MIGNCSLLDGRPSNKKMYKYGTSLPFGSENLWKKSGFKFPETTRLYSQREYATPKIIPSAANVATKLFLWKAPTKMKNSSIKLLVPGELILAKVEEKKMVGRFGFQALAFSKEGDSKERDNIQRNNIDCWNSNACPILSRRKTMTCTINLDLLALILEVEAAWLGYLSF